MVNFENLIKTQKSFFSVFLDCESLHNFLFYKSGLPHANVINWCILCPPGLSSGYGFMSHVLGTYNMYVYASRFGLSRDLVFAILPYIIIIPCIFAMGKLVTEVKAIFSFIFKLRELALVGESCLWYSFTVCDSYK